MTKFLRNAWYVAGWASELADGARVGRTLLDEPVLLYRAEDGGVIAIGNRCPHRFAPLDMGKRFGDVIACPYHGLRFDRTGACVHNPHGDGRIPAKARVPSYPLVEKDLLLWIWMGEPAAADPAAIPDYGFLVSGDYSVHADMLTLACNYQLAADNLMDLSHAVFVHENSFGTPDALKGRLDVAQDGNRVSANIWVADCTPAGGAFPLAGPGKPVDHWLDMEWSPAGNMLLKVGTTLPGRPRAEGVEVLAPHLLTPETDLTTHYFFASALPAAIAAVRRPEGAPATPTQKYVFENEDEPILAAVQTMMRTTDLWSLEPVLLSTDAGAVRVRRVLQSLIDAEARAVPVS